MVPQCLWKFMSNMEAYVDRLNLDMVLLDVHLFLKAYRGSFWESRSSDTPLRTVRTILYKLAAIKGHKLLRHAEMVAGQEESGLVQTINKMLKMHARKSAELASNAELQNKNKDLDHKAIHQQFKNTVHKIGTDGGFDEGLRELHSLCKKHPDYDLDQCMRNRSSNFRELVRSKLADFDRPGSNVAHVLPLRDSNRTAYSAGDDKGTLPRLTKDCIHWSDKEWAERTRTILNFAGLDTMIDPADQHSEQQEGKKALEDRSHILEMGVDEFKSYCGRLVEQADQTSKRAMQIYAELGCRNPGNSASLHPSGDDL